MNITEIDNKKDLFLIENLVTEELMDKLSKVVLEDIPSIPSPGQEHFERRRLVFSSGSVFEQIEACIDSHKESIGAVINKSITRIVAVYWLDFPGFQVMPHFDNSAVHSVMQIYLKDCDDMGTVFYNPALGDIEIRDDTQRVHYTADLTPRHLNNLPIRYTYECKKNTGYLMVNNDNQLHGVPNKQPEGKLRLSAYCYLHFEENE